MASRKSTEIGYAEASPRTLQNPLHSHGRVRIKSATVAAAAADDDGIWYLFFRVKSTDSIKSLQLYHDGITGATDYDVGLYQTAANGAAVLNADLYADGLNLEVACPAVPHVLATAPYLECRFGATATATVQEINQQVAVDAGLTVATAATEYDVAITANTVGSSVGDMTLVMYYTAGD